MRIPKLYPFFLAFFLCPTSGIGQTDSTEDWRTYEGYREIRKSQKKQDSGKLRFHQPRLLDSLIARYRRLNEEFPGIEGYRVQLFFGERDKAEKLKEDFKREYGEVSAYIDYLAPNFRLRVGDYRTRIEAYRLMQEIGGDFGRAYIVRTKIELPELKVDKKEKKD